jgi:hypothetical protein
LKSSEVAYQKGDLIDWVVETFCGMLIAGTLVPIAVEISRGVPLSHPADSWLSFTMALSILFIRLVGLLRAIRR